MLSQTGIYALQAVLHLASRDDDQPVAAAAMADELGIPANYLAKTLHRLGREGLLESIRGARGGYRLAVDPRELPVARVVEPFEDRHRPGRCLMGGTCDPDHPCPAHERWAAWSSAALDMLEHTTVAELVPNRFDLNGNHQP